jgi:HSP20 family protein
MVIEKWRPGSWLSPGSPFRELEDLSRRMEDFIRPLLPSLKREPVEEKMWSPAIEMYEEKDKFIIKAELPGMKKEDIDVSLADNTLTLKGERKAEKETKESNYYCCERYYGSFYRQVTLPSNADLKKIEAAYKDGVLEIKLPKTEETKEQKIDIKTE